MAREKGAGCCALIFFVFIFRTAVRQDSEAHLEACGRDYTARVSIFWRRWPSEIFWMLSELALAGPLIRPVIVLFDLPRLSLLRLTIIDIE